MFNPFAILFAIIDIAEPAIEDDDTVEFMPLVLHVEPIKLADLLGDATRLENAQVQYHHFSDHETYLGHIRGVREVPGTLEVYIEPVKVEGMSLLPKWKRIIDVTGYAFYATEGK